MDKEELRLKLASARRGQRAAEREIRRIREQSRSYRSLGFGQDINDIQLMALQDQRTRSHAEARRILRQLGIRPPAPPSLQSWLLLPVALLMSFLAGHTAGIPRPTSVRGSRAVASERLIR